MPLPKFTVKKWKDGREVARFRDTQGLVRTRPGLQNFTRLEQVRELTNYGILLQLAQLDAGLGSNGQAMKPLAPNYSKWKSKIGLDPKRNLLGPGGLVKTTDKNGNKRILRSAGHMMGRGHMRDDIRINYLDDKKATIAITNTASRNKARGNEQKSPWWGWSPASIQKLRQKSGEMFGTGPAERMFELGLIGVSALAFVKAKFLRRVA